MGAFEINMLVAYAPILAVSWLVCVLARLCVCVCARARASHLLVVCLLVQVDLPFSSAFCKWILREEEHLCVHDLQVDRICMLY